MPPKIKDYILPLIFLKRLSDVFEDELERPAEEMGDEALGARIVQKDRRAVSFFYIPEEARWPPIRQRTTGLGSTSPMRLGRWPARTLHCRAS